MILIGLTGGIGAGKSFVSELFIQQALPLIDTDIIARQLLEPEQAAWAAVKEHFGASFFSADGSLDRGKLASLIFTDGASMKWLNQLMHPMIRQQWSQDVCQLKETGHKVCVVVIPLLFETDAQSAFDTVICMACSSFTQKIRLKKRGWNQEHIESRIASQWPMPRKMNASHHVIWTDCAKHATQDQCHLVLQQICKANRDA